MDLEARDLSACYDGARILKEINVRGRSGEFVGIIGPNGSGKSTLLKCMYRILTPSSGAVYLNGEPLEDRSVKASAREIAVVAQHNYYPFAFSVEDIVMMGRSPHKKLLDRDTAEDFAIVTEALRTVGMEAFRNRTYSTLSGGEQQRIMLARALAQKTPCLILDEPTNHLDIKYQLELLDIVKSLGLTVIAAIHDLNIAAMYCDRIYVLKDGRVRAEGPPAALLTEELIRDVYEVEAEVLRQDDGRVSILYRPGSRLPSEK